MTNLKHFNPLPRKEGDYFSRAASDEGKHFNPLPRKEGDVSTLIVMPEPSAISIHSLVKRETQTSRYQFQCSKHFNPLPRKEGDL